MQTGGQERGLPPAKAGQALAPGRRAARPARKEAAADAPDAITIALGFDSAAPDCVAVDAPARIDAALLASTRAQKVICPLFAEDYDALVVAGHLRSLGFDGTLVVLAPDLPNPRMVEREIRNQAGGLRVSVVVKP
ncbi:hypothetical protein G5V65_13730 [Rhodobacter sp. HX-7-19]|uniref:Uncharacterized protein n=1 Tax=Paragemmobacter kunshanensis TaxID=2583234 RepID=A0A6M1TP97_9RHOB|nr:hypothetical protein [Rhodobacter kunshanensis]NGQ91959.1 hypothetical protein [Rhodobacter kunshanensis]